MAFVLRPTATVTFTIEDKQRASTCSFNISLEAPGVVSPPGGFDLPINSPGFSAYVLEFASSLQNVTDCRVIAISVSISWVQDTLPAFGTDANVERKGVLQFLTEDGFQTIFTIPGIKNSAIGGDGVSIIRNVNVPGDFAGNPLETHLESIHDKLRNGATIDLANYPAVDRRGADIRDLIVAYQQHRANPRG